MIRDNIELTVLVRGRPITEYPHQDQVFVEGRAGSEYELEIRNHSYGRIEAVVSVDGLSVIDGKLAGTESRGYLLRAKDSIRIPGWRLDGTQVAKFAFAGKGASYASQMTGDARNDGVIGVMAFREKINWFPPVYAAYNTMTYDSTAINPLRGMTLNSNNWSGVSVAPVAGVSMSASAAAPATSYARTTTPEVPLVQQNLGTMFGDATTFTTTMVHFERAGVICVMVLGYDDVKGLRARGISVRQRKPQVHQPNPFPASGCQPPPGWKG